ncbi:MAG: hypothetical protein OK422_03750 [Thaumarchaeota archaeon]|nr:hypothetical protein [Nitrososphaerota archaeon]
MEKSESQEVVLVVDVTSFTERGFRGTTTFGGKGIEIDFDDRNAGLVLSGEMAKRLHVKTGSKVKIILDEEGKMQVSESIVKGVGKGPKISDEKTYYAIGHEGGAIIRLRKG